MKTRLTLAFALECIVPSTPASICVALLCSRQSFCFNDSSWIKVNWFVAFSHLCFLLSGLIKMVIAAAGSIGAG
jgi:hypothetical protein